MQIFSGGLKNIHRMELAHQAMNHAENVMSEILTDETIREPLELAENLDEEFRYEAVVDYWEEPKERLSIDIVEMDVYLLSVRVNIHFKNDRYGKVYRTASLKTVSREPAGSARGQPASAIQQLLGRSR